MATLRDSRSLIEKCACLALLIAVVAADAEKCDVSSCEGPLRYYDDLGCTPVYEKPGQCCPTKYDCSHLKNRSPNKCYVRNNEYEVGEQLKPEDANPCDIGCTCSNHTEPASFNCAVVDCFFGPVSDDCFMRRSPDKCCPERVCLKDGETRATCNVDGQVYQEGDYFQPESDPMLNCYCMKGYQGRNVDPFCKKLNRPSCSVDFRNPSAITDKCAPVYYSTQNPATDCSVSLRCQNDDDEVVHTHDELTSAEEADTETCQFGSLTLHLHDKLKRTSGYDSKCVECVCNVPPFLTCKRDDQCQ